MKRTLLEFGLIAACLMPLRVTAQAKPTGFQVETFEPLPAQSTNIGNLASSQPLADLSPSVGLTLHIVDDPIEVRTNGEVSRRLVDDQLKAEIALGFGVTGWVDFGVALPVVLFQSSDDLADLGNADGVSGLKLADTRLLGRVRVLKPEWAGGVGAALMLGLYLPTGDTNSFNGDGRVRVEPRLAVDWSHEIGLRALANLGYQARGARRALNYVSDDILKWGLGLEGPAGLEGLSATALLFGSTSFADGRDPVDLAATAPNVHAHPVEAQLGARYRFGEFMAHASAGAGLSSDVGAPDFRVLAGIEWTTVIQRDRDGDGVIGGRDECPAEAEDIDGFEDGDGCPDLDNDGDGVWDGVDQCAEPEDLDGFEDDDGCPDLDNDGDGLVDGEDRCSTVAGTKELFGCPPEDNDGDGVFDHLDQCPEAPEDFDGFADEDGCPEIDNDGDGLADSVDVCPLEPEIINGKDDLDGCPDEGAATVTVLEAEVQLTKPLEFGSGSRLRWRDRKTLDDLASAMKNHSTIATLRIESRTVGNTDADRGRSLERANAVQAYLVGKGVEQERLQPVGLGGSQPLDPAQPVDSVRLFIGPGTAEPETPAKDDGPEQDPDSGFDFSEEG